MSPSGGGSNNVSLEGEGRETGSNKIGPKITVGKFCRKSEDFTAKCIGGNNVPPKRRVQNWSLPSSWIAPSWGGF